METLKRVSTSASAARGSKNNQKGDKTLHEIAQPISYFTARGLQTGFASATIFLLKFQIWLLGPSWRLSITINGLMWTNLSGGCPLERAFQRIPSSLSSSMKSPFSSQRSFRFAFLIY